MGLLGVFIVAVIMAFLFSGYKKKDSVLPLIILFLVLFFAGMTAHFWITPFGPVILGINWVPVLLAILLFTLLFSAQPLYKKATQAKDSDTNTTANAISVFIWILLIVLIVASVIGFYKNY